jgi:hypothetical protein
MLMPGKTILEHYPTKNPAKTDQKCILLTSITHSEIYFSDS